MIWLPCLKPPSSHLLGPVWTSSFGVKLTEPIFTGPLSVHFPSQPSTTHNHAYTHIPMHVHTYIHHVHPPYMHTHTHPIRTHSCMQTWKPTHPCMHAHMCTYMLTTDTKYFCSSHSLLLPRAHQRTLCHHVDFSQIWNMFISTHVSPLHSCLPHKAFFKAQFKTPLPHEDTQGPSHRQAGCTPSPSWSYECLSLPNSL